MCSIFKVNKFSNILCKLQNSWFNSYAMLLVLTAQLKIFFFAIFKTLQILVISVLEIRRDILNLGMIIIASDKTTI